MKNEKIEVIKQRNIYIEMENKESEENEKTIWWFYTIKIKRYE